MQHAASFLCLNCTVPLSPIRDFTLSASSTVPFSMSNFSDSVNILRSANRIELVKVLGRHAVTPLHIWRSLNAQDFVTWCLEADLPTDTVEAAIKWQRSGPLTARLKPGHPQQLLLNDCKRKDLPVGKPTIVSKRSKIQIALEVARDPIRYRAEQDKFVKDQWAASSLGPKESLWHT